MEGKLRVELRLSLVLYQRFEGGTHQRLKIVGNEILNYSDDRYIYVYMGIRKGFECKQILRLRMG